MDDEYESPPQKLVKARGIEAPEKGGLFIGGTRKSAWRYNIFVGCLEFNSL